MDTSLGGTTVAPATVSGARPAAPRPHGGSVQGRGAGRCSTQHAAAWRIRSLSCRPSACSAGQHFGHRLGGAGETLPRPPAAAAPGFTHPCCWQLMCFSPTLPVLFSTTWSLRPSSPAAAAPSPCSSASASGERPICRAARQRSRFCISKQRCRLASRTSCGQRPSAPASPTHRLPGPAPFHPLPRPQLLHRDPGHGGGGDCGDCAPQRGGQPRPAG